MANEVQIKVEGMHCSSCATGVMKVLENKGLKNVSADFADGEVSFSAENASQIEIARNEIEKLGYKVVDDHLHMHHSEGFSLEKKFYICLIFTVPLFVHMFLPFSWLHDPIVQLFLCIPVALIGAVHFGKSAWLSIKAGVPNMDVLIALGAGAAFLYSLLGTILYYGSPELHNYLFYETSATIITLVLLGNLMEHRSVKQTTSALNELSKIRVDTARKQVKDLLGERVVEVSYSDIKPGDILVVNNGDKVPVDGAIVWGAASVDESLITGESFPADKGSGDKVIGGTIVVHGNFRMAAESTGKETVLSQIIDSVRAAQLKKPSIQKLGDKISSVFVPVVASISFLTFAVSYFVFDISLQKALMNSIAVLVISCPCAMGLATPTAVMVGIGRAARKGIVIKGGDTIEKLSGVKIVVFDKTGTLTTGKFRIKKINYHETDEARIKGLICDLERNSSHPIARSLLSELGGSVPSVSEFIRTSEEKGIGVTGEDKEGNTYTIGSYSVASSITQDESHTLYLLRNNTLLATVDLEDEVKNDAVETIGKLKAMGLRVVLLSGDTPENCRKVAEKVGISEVFARCLPDKKMEIIARLSGEARTAMVGDGINDAPSLSRADVGISMGGATSVAIQSAEVVLLKGHDLGSLHEAIRIGNATFLTIRQNLFWAFFYNVIAIPVAAAGMLNPMIGALLMGLSDVVVIGNSLRLKTKRLS